MLHTKILCTKLCGNLRLLCFVGPALWKEALWRLERQHMYGIYWHLRMELCSIVVWASCWASHEAAAYIVLPYTECLHMRLDICIQSHLNFCACRYVVAA